MEPTEAQSAAFNTVGDIFRWAGLLSDPADDATPAGSFIRHIGLAVTDHWRVITVIA